MKATKTKNSVKNYVLPGEPMTQQEFESLIKEAEKGPFTSWEQEKKEFEEWKKNRKK